MAYKYLLLNSPGHRDDIMLQRGIEISECIHCHQPN